MKDLLFKIVSRETNDKLKQYQELLLKWQKAVNLVGPDTLDDAWNRHLIDSIQILEIVSRETILMDWGSGGGFPGLPLAIAKPDLAAHLVESDSKKCSFLKTVIRETGARNATVHNKRIDDLGPPDIPVPGVITARALAALPQLLEWALPWVGQNPDLRLVLHKGARADDEIAATKAAGFQFDLKRHPSVTDKDAAVLEITNLRK